MKTMTRAMRATLSGALGLALAGTLAFSASAGEAVDLAATLSGEAEDAGGDGKMSGSYDAETKTLSYRIEYSGLTGTVQMAHFHGPAEPGENAGVAVPIPGDDEGDLSSPVVGEATLTDEQAEALLGGLYYVNLHTEANPGGEIRGQVEKAKKADKDS